MVTNQIAAASRKAVIAFVLALSLTPSALPAAELTWLKKDAIDIAHF